MDPVTPSATGIFPPAQNGRPAPPAATLVGGGGSGERNNPGRALRDPCSPLSDIQKDGAALSLEKQSGQGIHSFLAQLASGVDPIPSLERVKLVGVYPDGRVLLMHLLFSVRVDIYSTSRRLFACLDELLAEPPPPVMEIPKKAFSAWHSICAMPQVDHVAHLGGIYPPDRQKIPCDRAGKTSGADRRDLDFRGLNFAPPGLRGLVIGYGGGRTSQRPLRSQGFVSSANRSIAYLRGGSRLDAICVYRGPGGVLCGACVHSLHPVCGSGGGQTLSGNTF